MSAGITDIAFVIKTNDTSNHAIFFPPDPGGKIPSPTRALSAEFALSWGKAASGGSVVGIGKYIAVWQYTGVGAVSTSVGIGGVTRIGLVGSNPPVVTLNQSGSTPSIYIQPIYAQDTYWVLKGSIWVSDPSAV